MSVTVDHSLLYPCLRNRYSGLDLEGVLEGNLPGVGCAGRSRHWLLNLLIIGGHFSFWKVFD